MKLIYLILGILLILTSESYSQDTNSLGAKSSQFNQEEVFESPELVAKGTSRAKSPDKIPTWSWGNGKPLSSSELLYSEIELKTPVEDWVWESGEPLASEESVVIPGQLTFPNWIKDTGNPITIAPEKVIAPPVSNNILITADHMTHDKKRDMIWAWGKVKIQFPDKTIQADNIKVNNVTGDGKAIGDVIITQSDGTRLKSQKALFNMNNKQGRLFESRGRPWQTILY